MSDLSEFLLARIAEDETVAQEAALLPEGVQRIADTLPDPNREWLVLNPDGEESLPIAPTAPDSPMARPTGDWGFHGGPIDHDDPEAKRFAEIFGEEPRSGVEMLPYLVHDAGGWDGDEPIGHAYYVAEVPGRCGRAVARHIVSHRPLRVLAECEAKRAIVEDHEYDEMPGSPVQWARELRLLALPYAGHPDYDERWRP